MKTTYDTKFVLTAIASIVGVIGIWLYTFVSLREVRSLATYGDIFGALNTLFSGLALAGVILTILSQRKELSLQREELTETRKELARTAIAQENSEVALRRQAENLKISAKLSALNTLVNYYSNEIERIDRIGGDYGWPSRGDLMDKKIDCIRRIETILEAKELG